MSGKTRQYGSAHGSVFSNYKRCFFCLVYCFAFCFFLPFVVFVAAVVVCLTDFWFGFCFVFVLVEVGWGGGVALMMWGLITSDVWLKY